MKCFYYILLLALYSPFVRAQSSPDALPVRVKKKPLDLAAFLHWETLNGTPLITSDGKFAAYKVTYNSKDPEISILKALDGNWTSRYPSARDLRFTADGRKAIFLLPGDTLRTIMLGANQSTDIPNVESFDLFTRGSEQWMIYYLKSPDRSLNTEDLNTGKKYSFPRITSYALTRDAKSLILKKMGPPGPANKDTLIWVNLLSGEAHSFFEGLGIRDLLLSDDGTQLVFSTSDRQQVFWRYPLGASHVDSLFGETSPGIKDPFEIAGIYGFSDDGDELLVNLKKVRIPNPPRYPVSLDVWAFNDSKVQSAQISDFDPNKIFKAVFNLSEHRFVYAQYDGNFLAARIGKKDSPDFVLLDEQKGDRTEWNWSKLAQSDNYAVFLSTGRREKVDLQGMMISPDQKFVVGLSARPNNRGSLCSYNLETGCLFDIDATIPVPMGLDNFEFFKTKGIYFECWLPGPGSRALVYDQYDLWIIDLSGAQPPVCLTQSVGRKNRIAFRIADERRYWGDDGLTLSLDNPVLLRAFNTVTKSEGFYRLTIGEKNDLQMLSMGPYNYTTGIGVDPLVKADKADIYLVERCSTDESPNYFSTTDFKSFDNVTDIHPENDYNWMRSELVTFRALDGSLYKGMLFKPEDFDASKKYPVIIQYYQQYSDNLYKYHYLIDKDNFSYPWFVSHGYLVFTPDIHFKVGLTGQSAVNSVVGAAKYLSSLKYVDSSKIGIEGHSFAGFETNYIVTHSGRFAAALSSSGSADILWEYFNVWVGGSPGSAYFENAQGRMGATPWEDLHRYINNSPLYFTDRVTTPLLTVADKLDGNVNFGQGVALFLALRRLGKPSWMLQYDGQAHGLSGAPFIDLTIRSQQFFDFYLKGAPAPKWMLYGIPAEMKGIDDGFQLDTTGARPRSLLLLTRPAKKDAHF